MVRTSVIQLAACVCFFPYFGNICNLLLKMPGNIFICWHTIHDIPEQMRARAYPCFISMVEQACLYFSLMNMEYKICDDLISHLSSVPAKNFKRVIWSDYTSVLCVKDDDIISDKELLVLDLVCWCDLHKFWSISYSCFNEKLTPPYI